MLLNKHILNLNKATTTIEFRCFGWCGKHFLINLFLLFLVCVNRSKRRQESTKDRETKGFANNEQQMIGSDPVVTRHSNYGSAIFIRQ